MKRIPGEMKDFIEVNDEDEEEFIKKMYPEYKYHGKDKMTKKKYYYRNKEKEED